MLQKTTYTFGISEWEFFWALPVGASLVMCKPEGHKLLDYMHDLMRQYEVTVSCFVPSALGMQLEYMKMEELFGTTSLRYLFTCGEVLVGLGRGGRVRVRVRRVRVRVRVTVSLSYLSTRKEALERFQPCLTP